MRDVRGEFRGHSLPGWHRMARLTRLLPGRLRRRVRGRTGRGERGAIGVLVAVLIGGGVLVGMGALVIDVGQLYQERAELQDGADAAALGVAKTCAIGVCLPLTAGLYAGPNASRLTGGTEGVSQVCGRGSLLLAGCPGSSGALTDCPAAPPFGTSYLDVHTTTQTAGGSSLLPPAFARTLLGNRGYRGAHVNACAQAEWGAPTVAVVAGITISACEWDQATNQGNNYAPAPPYPPNPFPAPGADQVLQLQGTGPTGGCPSEPNGAAAAASFSWTDDPGGTCGLSINGAIFGGDAGLSVSQPCRTLLSNARANKSVIFVAVYVSASGSTSNLSFGLKGFAAFVVTGYHMGGFTAGDWLNASNDCTGNQFCLNGYFTTALIPSGHGLGGQDLGADIIKLSG
jgi:putative Flp pilus-assembly TadE/G-like protein